MFKLIAVAGILGCYAALYHAVLPTVASLTCAFHSLLLRLS